MTVETKSYETMSNRDLDALVAERVMAGEQWAFDDWGCRHRYSTTAIGAFSVLEAMRVRGWSVWVRSASEVWTVTLDNERHPRSFDVDHDSMPRAAVIASLKALDAEAGGE